MLVCIFLVVSIFLTVPTKAVSQAQINQWRISLDSLLACPVGRALFIAYSQKIFGFDKLEFILDCEQLGKLQDPAFIQNKVEEMYNKYITEEAESALTVAFKLKSDVKKEVEKMRANGNVELDVYLEYRNIFNCVLSVVKGLVADDTQRTFCDQLKPDPPISEEKEKQKGVFSKLKGFSSRFVCKQK